MRKPDQHLCRVWALCIEDWTDEVEDEIGKLLPSLIDAGYVRTYGHTRTGFLWRFTSAGLTRAQKMRD
jgi:hypothetical protein